MCRLFSHSIHFFLYWKLNFTFRGGQTQASRATIQPGVPIYQTENDFTKESGIPGKSVMYLVKQQTQLDHRPQGLYLPTPATWSLKQILLIELGRW